MSRRVRTTLLSAVFSVFVGVAAGCGGGSGGSAPVGNALAGNGAAGDAVAAGGDVSGNTYGFVQKTGKRIERYVVDPRRKMAQEPDLPGVHSYIIHFNEQPAAVYDGGVEGYPATRPGAAAHKGKRGAQAGRQAAAKGAAIGGRAKFKAGSPEVIAYKTYLKSRQDMHVQKIAARTGRHEVRQRLTVAVNAVVMRMTQAEARKVSRMNEVRFVERNRAFMPDTDFGPRWIGADNIWDGNIQTGAGTRGEGILIGILDSGVSIGVDLAGGQAVDFVGPDVHPSFNDAVDVPDSDGYDHQWTGSYLGACDPTDTDQYLPEAAGFCNDKLVGFYENLDAQDICDDSTMMNCDQYGPTDSRIWNYKDTDGHGSHVMATAGGNVLFDVPIIDADGNPNPAFVSPEISGVAPHANIVAFKVCAPSCFFSDIAAATETAIEIGVDVLNMSIGNSYDPWSSTSALGFLNAHAAGITVANSAGNSGPGANTVNANSSPWVMGTGASSHDRSYPEKFLQDLSGGDTPAPGPLNGLAATGGLTGAIVYAGDFPTDNGSANDTEPEQCLDPFPAGTFTSDQIVVCDRGSIARVAKGQNVRDGGAGGLVLANIDGGATTVVADAHVIPAIHMDATNGNALKAWLAGGADHAGTITAGEPAVSDPAVGDIFASFSSRGPFTGYDLLAPHVTAPGSNIFSAGAQNLFDHPGTGNDAPAVNGLFGTISGTSMSSPHAAGSAALIKAVHPDWAPSEIISALMTTGHTTMLKEDGATPADPFDFGGGRVQPAVAVDAGLVLFESATNFENGDPAAGGDESALNVSGLVSEQCVGVCSWERTVTAVRDGSWTVSGGFTSAEPSAFTLSAGESQTLVITADALGLPGDGYSFDFLEFTPASPDLPSQHLTVAIQPATGNIPDNINIDTGRSKGSWLLSELTSLGGDQLTSVVYGHEGPREVHSFGLAQDSDNSDYLDDLNDGVWWTIHPFPNFAELLVYEITDTTSPDLDMFVGLDDNGNGIPDADDPLLCVSATATAFESCLIDIQGFTFGEDIDIWVAIQNWQASAPDAIDDVLMARTVLTRNEQGNLSVEGPAGPIAPLEPFDLRVFFSNTGSEGELRYGRVYLYGDASQSEESFLGNPIVRIVRGPNDVDISMPDLVAAREFVDIDVTIQPNRTPEERNYEIRVRIPGGTSYVEGSAEEFGGYFDGNDVFFNVTQPSLLTTEPSYAQSTNDPTRADYSETCNTGFGDGQYLDLFGGFGFEPSVGGDDDTFGFDLSGPTNFYGTVRPASINVNTNGFLFFDSDPGSNFINTPIPDPGTPNDMTAVYWTDLITALDFSDPTDPGGITAAVIPGVLSLFEFDNATEWTPDPALAVDSVDFQVWFYNEPDPTPGVPEVIFAYDNLDRTSGVPFLTVGVENPTGTAGTQFVLDDPSAVTDGLIICYDLEGPSSEPTQIGFQIRPRDRAAGSFKTFKLFDSVDDPGATGTHRDQTKTFVFNGYYDPVEDGYVHQKNRNLFLAFRIFDPETGENVQDRAAELVMTDSSGTEVLNAPFEPRGLDYFLKVVTKDLAVGVHTLTLRVEDGDFVYAIDIELTD